jgi:putative DNA methylase
MMCEHKGWYSRGYLPHFDAGETPQFVTFHLDDSIPVVVRERWAEELKTLPTNAAEKERRRRIEAYLDRGEGEAWMRVAAVADIVEEALLHFDGERYLVHGWAVMPNHGHTLFTPREEYTLDQILHSWKSYTAHEANKLLKRSGRFWAVESYDRYIRNEEHFMSVLAYIESNPVKAGLCERPEDWRWSSAYRRRAERP